MTRSLAAAVALAAAGVLVAGTAVALTADREERADVLQADPGAAASAAPASAVPSPRSSPAPPSPATATSSQPRPAEAEPANAPAPAPRPAVEPRPAAGQSAPDDGSGYGATPGVVKHPYDPGRRTYSATTDGVTLSATFSTTTPKAGEPVTVSLSGSSTAPTCCSLDVLYGDGSGDDQQLAGGDPCGDATSARYSPQHAWNRPGRYTLQLQASTSGCSAGQRHVVMRVVVEVGPGAPPVSNGQARPQVSFDIYEYPKPEDPGLVKFSGMAEDRDGHVTHFVLDPGDGSAPRRLEAYKQGPCQQTSGGTSAASTGFLSNDPPPSHRYREPGSYTATLTAYSYGCDGQHEQTGQATYTHTW